MLRLVAERFADGTYQPLPMTTFPVQQTGAALRLLGQARHIGKVVIKVSGTDVELDAPPPVGVARPSRLRSYLVTGGTGGFGREVAGWLADQGAGAIVLMSRSGGDPATLGGAAGTVRAGDGIGRARRRRRRGGRAAGARRDPPRSAAAARASCTPR